MLALEVVVGDPPVQLGLGLLDGGEPAAVEELLAHRLVRHCCIGCRGIASGRLAP